LFLLSYCAGRRHESIPETPTLDRTRLETLRLDQLRPWPRNARTHSRKQLRQIADSIRRFGFTNPLLIDSDNRILAGHGRVAAARELGMATTPCLRVDHMSAAEKRAYVLADNKIALNAGWDEELRALELKELMAADVDFDVGLTGFSIAEVDQLIDGLAPEEQGDPADDRLPEPDSVPARSQPGDIWRLGPHQLICGDALDPTVLAALMDGEKAEMIFTDPPYNVAIEGHASGLGKMRHREFAIRRDDARRVHGFSFLRLREPRRAQPRRLDPLRLHGLAPHGRDVGGGRGALRRVEEFDRLGEGQRRHGLVLPLPARIDLRVQERGRSASQQLRARPARALSHQRLGVSRRQHAEGRPARRAYAASDRQAGRDDRRRHQGCLAPRRPFRRLRLDADRRP
jgi:hypothetical protein